MKTKFCMVLFLAMGFVSSYASDEKKNGPDLFKNIPKALNEAENADGREARNFHGHAVFNYLCRNSKDFKKYAYSTDSDECATLCAGLVAQGCPLEILNLKVENRKDRNKRRKR